MDDNPYQSPHEYCEVGDPFGDQFPLGARFACSHDLLRRACRSYVAESPILILLGMCALLAGIVPAVVFPSLFDGEFGTFYGIGIFVWAALVWTAGNRLLFRRTLHRVEAHPALGSTADRLVQINSDRILLTSGSDRTAWPLADALERGSKPEFLVLELGAGLLLVIPWEATVDPQPFDAFRLALRRRMRRYAWRHLLTFR
jgi:hypothetical protein